MLIKIKEYFRYVYEIRYFWAYLARCDLLARNRRSKLGMLWIIMSPLMLTVIMAVVLGTAFRIPIIEYAPYIFVGMVIWELIVSSVVSGGGSFVSATPYMKQFNHRVTIYTLKTALVNTVNFLIGCIGVFLWISVTTPANLFIGFLTLPMTTFLFFLMSWALTTIASFVNVKYRDYQQMMSLFMQALWYISPVFFQESLFQSNKLLLLLFRLNPITHILYLLRKPLLNGRLPSVVDYLFSIGFILFLGMLAIIINKKYEKKVIFYL
ncbi:MAG: ABC transporter permease [Bacteroidales bacterium]|jgi:lipopolysaccharide transport system permease protein|nr:ABC transporter permease [Bacteroidales bacterium]